MAKLSDSEIIANAFKRYEEQEKELTRFGVHDTEPQSWMCRAVRAGLGIGSPLKLPQGFQWELYSSEPGVKLAAKRMTGFVNQLIKELKKVDLSSEVNRNLITGRMWY